MFNLFHYPDGRSLTCDVPSFFGYATLLYESDVILVHERTIPELRLNRLTIKTRSFESFSFAIII